MRKSFTSLTEQMSKKGFKLRTWAKFKKLNESDYRLFKYELWQNKRYKRQSQRIKRNVRKRWI